MLPRLPINVLLFLNYALGEPVILKLVATAKHEKGNSCIIQSIDMKKSFDKAVGNMEDAIFQLQPP